MFRFKSKSVSKTPELCISEQTSWELRRIFGDAKLTLGHLIAIYKITIFCWFSKNSQSLRPQWLNRRGGRAGGKKQSEEVSPQNTLQCLKWTKKPSRPAWTDTSTTPSWKTRMWQNPWTTWGPCVFVAEIYWLWDGWEHNRLISRSMLRLWLLPVI